MPRRNFYEEIKSDISKINDFIEYYNSEYLQAEEETKIKGNIVDQAKELPSLMAYRFSQLQEIEAVLRYIELLRDQQQSKCWLKYSSGYNRSLQTSEKKYYVMGDKDFISIETWVNDVAFIRNKFLAITKGFDSKNFALSNIIKLKTAGIDDWAF